MIAGVLGAAAFALVSLVLGVGLLLMWRRTRKIPELLIGLTFLFEGVLSNTCNVLERFHARFPPEWWGPIHMGSVVSSCAAAICCAIAAWRIFRPKRAWARALTAFCIVLLAAYTLDSALPRPGEPGPRNLTWWWIGIIPRAGAHAWMGVEAFLYQRMMRRRLRLGLGDPVVANRMWLWSCAGAATSILWLGVGVARTVGGAGGLQQPATLLFIAVLGLITSACNWLVFQPPRAYLAMIERRAAEAA